MCCFHPLLTNVQVIERMHDMVGIRITTYFPSLEIPQIINVNVLIPPLTLLFNSFRMKLTSFSQLLHLHFDVIAVKPGATPEYRGTNVHVRIENTDCEVQLRGAFEHAFYQIQHKFGYKVKGAQHALSSTLLSSLIVVQALP
jgi:ppGpp synthetase/RelA/SpoT-type nucleotidyltranferase